MYICNYTNIIMRLHCQTGLKTVTVEKYIPTIEITLSLDALDTASPGYQPPLPESQVTTQRESFTQPGRGGRGRGRGGRGGATRTDGSSEENTGNGTSNTTATGESRDSSRGGRGGRGRGRGGRGGRGQGGRGRGRGGNTTA